MKAVRVVGAALGVTLLGVAVGVPLGILIEKYLIRGWV